MSEQKSQTDVVEWEEAQKTIEQGGVAALLELIASVEDPLNRLKSYSATMQNLTFKDWRNKSIDAVQAVGLAGVDYGESESRGGGEHSERLFEGANIIAYNLAANLADCWGDEFTRGPAHFETGLRVAERAIAFREQLKKGPGPFSMAYWAKGIHLFSLGRYQEAATAFQSSLEFAEQGARDAGKSDKLDAKGSFGVILGHGYLALAALALEQIEARAQLDQVYAAFEGMKELSDDAKADAEIGISQLRNVEKKLA